MPDARDKLRLDIMHALAQAQGLGEELAVFFLTMAALAMDRPAPIVARPSADEAAA